MGRNRKTGLDWWPRDIGLYRDPKLRGARQRFGVLGPYVYECLLDMAYGDKGYFIEYSGQGREDALWQLREYTAGLENVTLETLAAVVDQLVASGLFSAELYERGFLTSKRIQMGYFIATLGRKGMQVNFDIWLLSEEEMREKNPSGKAYILRAFISRQEKPISCPESTQRTEEQRTEEDRRVEDSREQDSTEEKTAPADAGLTAELENKLDCKFDRNFCNELEKLKAKGMEREVFLEAARQTADKVPRNPAGYLRTVLQNYARDGVLTAADLAAREKPAYSGIGPSAPQLTAYDAEWLARVKAHSHREAAPS